MACLFLILTAPVPASGGTPIPGADLGFESPALGAGAFQYQPSGSPWAFGDSTGISGNGSGFTGDNPNAPEGVQVGFVQYTGSISQALASQDAGDWTVTFAAAQRGGQAGQTLRVLLDGNAVGTVTPAGTTYADYTVGPVHLQAGTHTLSFVGTDPNGGDNTAFLDNVRVSIANAVTPPPTPTGLTATAISGSETDLAWTAATGATAYNLYRCQDTSGGETLYRAGLTGTSFHDTGLTVGRSYYYRVTAVASNAESLMSNEAVSGGGTAIPGADLGFESPALGAGAFQYQPSGSPWAFGDSTGISGNGSGFTGGNPNAPEGVQVGFVQGTGMISQPLTSSSAGAWTVTFSAAQRGSGNNGGQAVQVLLDGASVGTVTPAGTTYAGYSVGPVSLSAGTHTLSFLATNPNGGDNTAFLDDVRVSIVAATANPPDAPTGLTASSEDGRVQLSWAASARATGYNVKRATTSGGPYAVIASSGTTPDYTDTGLANDTIYYYVVSATNASGEGGNSGEAAGTPLASPSGLTAVPGSGQVQLSWTAVAGATGYSLKRAAASGGPYAVIASGGTVSAYTDAAVTNGTVYFYVVSAVSAGGESDTSGEALACPLSAPPAPTAAPDYGYTGGGLRAWKQSASGPVYFLYDGSVPVCEMDGAGSVTAVNTFGPTGLLSRAVGNPSSGYIPTFYAFDPGGSVSERLDGGGNILGQYAFDAFGLRAGMDSTADPYASFGGRWGYYRDAETGLELLGHRYYDSATGRFVTRDPLGYGGGVNLYAYARNNPVGGIDPDGTSAFFDGISDNLLFGTDKALGDIAGRYDAGCASAGDVAWAGAKLVGAIALNVIPGGGEAEVAGHGAEIAAEAGEKGFVDLARADRRSHILEGEQRPNGTWNGGHGLGRGRPNKSEFPIPDDEAMHHISDIATDPSLPHVRAGSSRFKVRGTRNTSAGSLDIEVITEPEGMGIVTGYPTSVIRNP